MDLRNKISKKEILSHILPSTHLQDISLGMCSLQKDSWGFVNNDININTKLKGFQYS